MICAWRVRALRSESNMRILLVGLVATLACSCTSPMGASGTSMTTVTPRVERPLARDASVQVQGPGNHKVEGGPANSIIIVESSDSTPTGTPGVRISNIESDGSAKQAIGLSLFHPTTVVVNMAKARWVRVSNGKVTHHSADSTPHDRCPEVVHITSSRDNSELTIKRVGTDKQAVAVNKGAGLLVSMRGVEWVLLPDGFSLESEK